MSPNIIRQHTGKGILRKKPLAPRLDHCEHLLTFQVPAVAKAMVGGNSNRHKTETWSWSASQATIHKPDPRKEFKTSASISEMLKSWDTKFPKARRFAGAWGGTGRLCRQRKGSSGFSETPVPPTLNHAMPMTLTEQNWHRLVLSLRSFPRALKMISSLQKKKIHKILRMGRWKGSCFPALFVPAKKSIWQNIWEDNTSYHQSECQSKM